MAARNPTPIGQTFGRLTVLAEAPKLPTNKNRRVTARCQCGVVKDYVLSEVRLGKTQSCGCLHAEGVPYRTHGHTAGRKFSPEYYSYSSMLTRCYNERSMFYDRYGGRGVTVCDRWRESFEAFLADMGPRPPGATLDRFPDRDGSYEPGNCRWASGQQQMRNRDDNTRLTYQGETLTIAEWAERSGLHYNTLIARIHRLKWPLEKALTTPPRKWPSQ